MADNVDKPTTAPDPVVEDTSPMTEDQQEDAIRAIIEQTTRKGGSAEGTTTRTPDTSLPPAGDDFDDDDDDDEGLMSDDGLEPDVPDAKPEPADDDELDVKLVSRALKAGVDEEDLERLSPKEIRALVEFAEKRGLTSEQAKAAGKELSAPDASAVPEKWEAVSLISDEAREQYDENDPLFKAMLKAEEVINAVGEKMVASQQREAALQQRLENDAAERVTAEADQWFAENPEWFGKGTVNDIRPDGKAFKRREAVMAAAQEVWSVAEKAGQRLSLAQALERADQIVNPGRAKRAKADTRNRKVRSRRTATPTNRGGGRNPEEETRPLSQQETTDALADVVEKFVR